MVPVTAADSYIDGKDMREGGSEGKRAVHRWKWHCKVVCLPWIRHAMLKCCTKLAHFVLGTAVFRSTSQAHLLPDGNYASISPNKSHFRQEANCISGSLRHSGTWHQQCRAEAWFAPHTPQLETEPVEASGPNRLLEFNWSLMKLSVIWWGCHWNSATGSGLENCSLLLSDALSCFRKWVLFSFNEYLSNFILKLLWVSFNTTFSTLLCSFPCALHLSVQSLPTTLRVCCCKRGIAPVYCAPSAYVHRRCCKLLRLNGICDGCVYFGKIYTTIQDSWAPNANHFTANQTDALNLRHLFSMWVMTFMSWLLAAQFKGL